MMFFSNSTFRSLLICLLVWGLSSTVVLAQSAAEEAFWEDCYDGQTQRIERIKCLREYLRKYPNGAYVTKAERVIQRECAFMARNCRKALQRGTVQAIRDYTFSYDSGKISEEEEQCSVNCLEDLKEALKRLDDRQWEKILASPRNIQLVNTYLDEFEEEGLRYKEVQRRKQLIENPPPDDEFWAESNGRGLIKLQEYLIFSRDQKYKDKAEKQLRNIEMGMWNQAKTNDIRSDYAKYIKAFPNGDYVAEARQAMKDLNNKPRKSVEEPTAEDKAWAAVPKQNLEKLREFIEENPNSKYVGEAKGIIREMDEMAWQEAVKDNATIAFEKYVMDFPDGIHLEEAKNKAAELTDGTEDEAWRTALEAHSAAAYSEYLAQYPEGKYVQKAKAAITKLRAGDYVIQLDDSTGDYVIQLSNVKSPTLVEQPDIDSLIVDTRELSSKNLLRAQIVNLGNYTLKVKDELGKIIPIELLDLISGEMNELEEQFAFSFNGGFQPYFLSFINNATLQEITFSDIPSQKYELAKDELSDYEGLYSVVLRDKRKTQKFVINSELPLEGNPMKRILIIGGLIILILGGGALWYFGYKKLKSEQSNVEDLIEDDDVFVDEPA